MQAELRKEVKGIKEHHNLECRSGEQGLAEPTGSAQLVPGPQL